MGQSEDTAQPDHRLDSMISKLKDVCADDATSKSALILRNSHVGGHKYAGNVIVRPRYRYRTLNSPH